VQGPDTILLRDQQKRRKAGIAHQRPVSRHENPRRMCGAWLFEVIHSHCCLAITAFISVRIALPDG
jgi:hypothetical protein